MRRGRGAALLAASAALTLTAACSSSSSSALPHAGPAQGIGDPYYPTDGNRGYDVSGYWVTTTYSPSHSSFTTRTQIRARALRTLPRFDLDLSDGLTVHAVRYDGVPARRFTRMSPHELVVTPPQPIAPGERMDVVVEDSGPVGASGPISGWHALPGGGGVMAGEPHSCAYWYACNDHPSDKATFHLTATVPAPYTVVSNGVEGRTTRGRAGGVPTRTFRWDLDVPATTYETTILVDRLTVQRSRLPDGTPVVNAYSAGATREEGREAQLPAILAFLSSRFGPYPAPAAGGMFVSSPVGFSLEAYSRPVYTAGVGVSTIVHENAHQWWGDNVSIRRWRDVCFNECMASYAQWLWLEHKGTDLDALYRRDLGRVDWSAPLYDMGAGHEFDFAGVYEKGAFFEHALRRKIGDDRAYFAALRGIQRDFAGESMGMLQFRDQLSRRTGVDLTAFWRQWVLSTGRPSRANLFPGTLGG